jgi:enamine deaminase RidA (YjgF/YER057c/UK114 family)
VQLEASGVARFLRGSFDERTQGANETATEVNIETQATKSLEIIKQSLAEEGMTFGDVVMMHAYLGPDPKTGQAERTGWGNAFGKYFGTAGQPNKPSRTSIQISFGGGPNLIEIEVIAVRPHKD